MNYGDLKTHFNAMLNRTDITQALTQQFLSDGITRIQRSLRTPMQEKTFVVNITTTTSSLTLPADFIETISLYQDQYELQRVPMKRYRELQQSSYIGVPKYYARIGPQLMLFPTPTSGTLTLYYYAEFPALVLNTDTNALTETASDLVIYSALTYAADHYMDERAPQFEAKYLQFMGELQGMADDQELNGGIQAVQPTYSNADY